MHGGQAPLLLQVPKCRLAKMRTSAVHPMRKLARDRLCAVPWASLHASRPTMGKWLGVPIHRPEGPWGHEPRQATSGNPNPDAEKHAGGSKSGDTINCLQQFA
jgi:hypothetical protein